ncbi:nucleoporin NDC1-like [Mya arenaria]|uniref:nucleoporin NDC1-like n=1 Tax=Mya arenaria TaxID=6604 RepID=UPI0022E326CF|nr:nucleoporin NDC1-like [Mya arenaria]
MDTIDKWFIREVLVWRSGAAVAWSVFSLPVIAGFYVSLTTLQPLHPLSWLPDTFGCVLSLSFISCVLLLMILNGLFYSYSRKTFTVVPTASVTRFSHLGQLCRGPVLLYMTICMGSGHLIGWVCTGLLGARYAGLTFKCEPDSESRCINEHHLFLVLYGGYTGLMYIVHHYIQQNHVIRFPQAQEAKYAQVRCQLASTVWSALGHVVWQIKFFYLGFYLLGGIPRDFIASSLSLNYGPGPRLDSMRGLLFDVALLWQTLLLGVFIQFSWTLAALLHKIYNTESYEFPISTMFDNFKNKCLVDAMSCTSLPLLQALGFQDLNHLSKHSLGRRKELFSLSQPGGHPHNWNKILAVCLSVLNELSEGVQEVNWKILASAPVRKPSAEKHAVTTEGGKTESSEADQNEKKSTVRERIINGIKRRPEMKFFTREGGEPNKSKNLFATAYLQIWTVEALASLVGASVREDLFGVVQMSLSDIVSNILNLHENVDKHFKLTGGVGRRSAREGGGASDLSLKYQLQASIKASIYNIVNTFGKHLLEVGLPPETEKRLQHFLHYRE